MPWRVEVLQSFIVLQVDNRVQDVHHHTITQLLAVSRHHHHHPYSNTSTNMSSSSDDNNNKYRPDPPVGKPEDVNTLTTHSPELARPAQGFPMSKKLADRTNNECGGDGDDEYAADGRSKLAADAGKKSGASTGALRRHGVAHPAPSRAPVRSLRRGHRGRRRLRDASFRRRALRGRVASSVCS